MTKKTGNDVDFKIPLNPLLEQVLAIVGTCHGTGLSIVREIGIKREGKFIIINHTMTSFETPNNYVHVLIIFLFLAVTKSATMTTIKSVRTKMNIRGMTPSQSSRLASQCNSDGEGSIFKGVESMETHERSNASA